MEQIYNYLINLINNSISFSDQEKIYLIEYFKENVDKIEDAIKILEDEDKKMKVIAENHNMWVKKIVKELEEETRKDYREKNEKHFSNVKIFLDKLHDQEVLEEQEEWNADDILKNI